MAEKRAVRAEVFAAGRALSQDARQHGSLAAQGRILSMAEFQGARTVALYAPLPREPDTALLFEEARAVGKRVVYPSYASGAPELRELRDLGELRAGERGLRHPPPGAAVSPGEVDVFVVPGVAFDREGHRLGRGQGFYDRLLAGRAAGSTAVGLCFDHALLERVEVEAHDRPVDYVASPVGLFERPGRKR